MYKVIEDKIEEAYNKALEKPKQILEIFNDHFGENFVDLQAISLDEFRNSVKAIPLRSFLISEIDNECLHPLEVISKETFEKYKEQLKKTFIDHLSSYIPNVYILVHFPQVRVTNENNRYIDIQDLYAKCCISKKGLLDGVFTLNRATYDLKQMISGYMHSHVSSIPTWDFSQFQSSCLGTGPIRNTMLSLNSNFSIEFWKLFCLELDKYVRVESLDGIPYHRLEQVGSGARIEYSRLSYHSRRPVFSNISISFSDFIKYVITSKKLKYNYVAGGYNIAMSKTECIITISNLFIEWYNKCYNDKIYTYSYNRLQDRNVLRKYKILSTGIFEEDSSININYYARYIGKKVCTFKGKDILLNITDLSNNDDENTTVLLTHVAVSYVVTTILNVLNYRYGNTKSNEETGSCKILKIF